MSVNATEAGDEPVGEAPELTMPRAARLVDRQTAAIAAIRERHVEQPSPLLTQPPTCEDCLDTWPCSTIRILQEHGL